jgi:uncharacterized OB-fold protein
MNQSANSSGTALATRERPLVNDDNAYFWDGIAAGRLLIQRCTGCSQLRHPSSPSCPRCRSLDWDVVEASRRGVIYSFVIVHQPPVPGLAQPHAVVLVLLEEGVRMVLATERIPHDQLAIGAPVTLGFVDDGDFAFPDCQLAETQTGGSA